MNKRLTTMLAVVVSGAPLMAQQTRPTSRASATTQASATTRPATRPIVEPVVSTFETESGTRITLDLKKATAKQVYAEIGKHSGVVLRPLNKELFDNPELAPVDFKVEGA